MGAMANLKLSFGLTMFDVAMQKASNERNQIKKNRMHKHADGTLHPTGTRGYCKDTTCPAHSELEIAAMSHGVEVAKGQFVEVTDAEIDAIKVSGTGAILVQETVTKEVFLLTHPELVAGSIYYLVPPGKDKYPPQTFALMLKALGDKVAIGRTAMYGRTQAVAIMAGSSCFKMFMLRYPDEVRDEPIINLPAVDERHVAMAQQIVASLDVPDMDMNYRDEYQDSFKALVDSKASGIALPAPVVSAPTVTVNNLEEMLKKTLEQMAATKKPAAKEKAVKTPELPAKPAKGGKKKERVA